MNLELELYIEKNKILRRLAEILVLVFILTFFIFFISLVFFKSYSQIFSTLLALLFIIVIFKNIFLEDYFLKKEGSIVFLEKGFKIKKNDSEILLNIENLENSEVTYIGYKKWFLILRFYYESGKNNEIKYNSNGKQYKYNFLCKDIKEESKLRDILNYWVNEGLNLKFYFKGKTNSVGRRM